MSSGFGIKGKVGRCYPFFADYKDCLQNREDPETMKVCGPERDDYFECLHHKKEFGRVATVLAQQKSNLEADSGGGSH
eukprot:CAMPEP_0178895162 /NCGR_PEP_ID=MMETSP0786-20121207/430_1 /TAXON_ID=186022 /ORGANISM="Thalassionema frauenfeldii, Strain CCMP 1798" /LENGTH=77 /DNA_ID=CAMNT_0020565355 /DNA_START=62 /DNA_END=295 /DNA_ORIENTATION=+